MCIEQVLLEVEDCFVVFTESSQMEYTFRQLTYNLHNDIKCTTFETPLFLLFNLCRRHFKVAKIYSVWDRLALETKLTVEEAKLDLSHSTFHLKASMYATSLSTLSS